MKTEDVIEKCCVPPEVCGPEAEEHQKQHIMKNSLDGIRMNDNNNNNNDNNNKFTKTLEREKPLLVGIAAMAVLMRILKLKYILYPFMIFSTWIHEMCHGMAAILVGGSISKIYVYKDGSGLCYSSSSGETWERFVVSCAGYTGTAVIGCLFLLFRRTRRGPTIGLIGMGCAMLLSSILYVRNAFGITMVVVMGLFIIVAGWKISPRKVLYLYTFMAATCSFNALDSISDLIGISTGAEMYVNGEEMGSDAQTAADLVGGSAVLWAVLWLIFGIVMSLIGISFPIDGATVKNANKEQIQMPYYASVC